MHSCTVICTDACHPVNSFLKKWRETVRTIATVEIVRTAADAKGGDFLFLISCQELVPRQIRNRFRHSLVIHASDLPRGRGMSPHVWQILEGNADLILSLLSVADPVDTGDIWHQIEMHIPRNAVFSEINALVFKGEVALMNWALRHCDSAKPRLQAGNPTQYRRRTPADSELDPAKPLAELFDQLRVADPTRYPAFFRFRGRLFRVGIEPIEE